jgi:bifunctional DNA-binding transcriptional regulator/antitoxin component of YhaV-PrlF toxin-antitoxin module
MPRSREPIARISSKHQVTVPLAVMKAARLRAGDRIRFESQGDGRIVVTPILSKRDLSRFVGLWRSQAPYASGQEALDDLRGPFER